MDLRTIIEGFAVLAAIVAGVRWLFGTGTTVGKLLESNTALHAQVSTLATEVRTLTRKVDRLQALMDHSQLVADVELE